MHLADDAVLLETIALTVGVLNVYKSEEEETVVLVQEVFGDLLNIMTIPTTASKLLSETLLKA